MALIQRNELSQHLDKLLAAKAPRIFLFFGERFLCRKAADELVDALLGWKKATLYSIDGDQEDSSQTLAKLMSYSLLPGLQLYRINDTRLFHSKNISQSLWDKAYQAYKADRQAVAVKYLTDMYVLASIQPQDRLPLAEMTEDQWQESFGLQKPTDLAWTTSLFNDLRQNSTTPHHSDMAEKYIDAFERGLPPQTMLLLSAENIDKRKRLYTYIKKEGLIVDCSVAEGSGAAAQKVQKTILREILQDTLARFKKTIEPQAVDVLFERVGFHPVAVQMEAEKLALYCDDQAKITRHDLDAMVGRSREDALFELTDHFSKRDLGKTLITLHHLLENGIHSLAILATMRNFVRKLLIFRSLQLLPVPCYQKDMNAKQFQDLYLPEIKKIEEWADVLAGHPYAIYMSFAKAAEYQCSTLKSWLELILEAEYQLKGSQLTAEIILEKMLITMLKGSQDIQL